MSCTSRGDPRLRRHAHPPLQRQRAGRRPRPRSLRLRSGADGEKWIEIGEISGGTAQIDIAKFIAPGDSFTLVRLTDLKIDCGGEWPGADIDAVGAIGGALHISLQSSVLFDFNESKLKDAARQALHDAAEAIRSVPGRHRAGGGAHGQRRHRRH